MSRILVSGLTNIETTLRVEGFPITYSPVRYPFNGVRSTVAGVGINIGLALHTLGDQVDLLTIVGNDMGGQQTSSALETMGLHTDFVVQTVAQTAQSVILYDSAGKRQINVDLKDIQETAYPEQSFRTALAGADLAVLCNINFSRPMLATAAEAGVPIATDVHTIERLDDPYNADFMRHADVLFMSDERLPALPEVWAREVCAHYGTPVIVIGLGEKGALLCVHGQLTQVAAVQTRPIVNTIGAGDALFSAFVHFYAAGMDPLPALRHAVVFASYKIGDAGAAEGFLTEKALLELAGEVSA
ncbi:MAG: carbohydrate kinase family protein [Chloroflexi bacterium]|nr:carbohydrate kinase family protein [Chloroflexota bacterium]